MINRVSTSEAVVNHFRDRIRAGELRPGDPLPSERQLRRDFGISRFSLREGLAKLQALGIVNIVHGKGAFVAEEMSSSSLENVFVPFFAVRDDGRLRDLFEARNVIEGEVAVCAAERRTEADLVRLRRLLDEMKEALDEPDRFGDLDYRFHHEIAVVAGNRFFLRMLAILTADVRRFLLEHARSPRSRRAALRTHREILASIEKQDVASAGRIMRRHIGGCLKNYAKSGREVDSRGSQGRNPQVGRS
ncbi:MAG: FadR family transcriptional regulator [Kiritimatiellae bacterium]|nr:FadR family transcriptional regulator [Kiritimatiellia bacterium]